MTHVAKHRYARIAPRKARLLADMVRGRKVDDALTVLQFAKQRAAGMVAQVIKSAAANATEKDADARKLVVTKCWVDPGPMIKRFQPKDRGKSYAIMKRTSHIVVEVDERD